MWKANFFLTLLLVLTPSLGLAEYRAYLLEVFDHIDQKKWEISTGFAPDKYIQTHGGGYRIAVVKKASWMCYGDTSQFNKICPMPPPLQPKFKKGDQVEILLDKHITQGWKGVVELSLYREDLNSNIYGIRFPNRRNLYGRYFEFNLKSPAQ